VLQRTPTQPNRREDLKVNIFTQHPYEQGVSYFEHWIFAMGIAWRLLRSAVAFAMHAVVPAMSIEKQLDLEATSAFLLERNSFIEAAANAGRPGQAVRPLAA
jgi:Family of unknown function (DUF6356)